MTAAKKAKGRPRRTRADAKARGVRLTDAEYAAAIKRAELRDQSFSEYVRDLIVVDARQR